MKAVALRVQIRTLLRRETPLHGTANKFFHGRGLGFGRRVTNDGELTWERHRYPTPPPPPSLRYYVPGNAQVLRRWMKKRVGFWWARERGRGKNWKKKNMEKKLFQRHLGRCLHEAWQIPEDRLITVTMIVVFYLSWFFFPPLSHSFPPFFFFLRAPIHIQIRS